jgi:hypothetical protein
MNSLAPGEPEASTGCPPAHYRQLEASLERVCSVICAFTSVTADATALQAAAHGDGPADFLWRLLIDVALVLSAGYPEDPRPLLRALWKEEAAEHGPGVIPVAGEH